MSLWSHQGKGLEWDVCALPFRAAATGSGGGERKRGVVRSGPAVTGGFGSQFSRRTSEKRRHVAPAHPAGWGAASITSHLRCARHTGSPSAMTTSAQPVRLGAHVVSGEPVMLDAEERRRHLYVVGQTGTGNSTVLL